MQQATAFCFNIRGEKFTCVQAAARAAGAAAVAVPQSDFSQPVGALIGVSERKKEVCLAPFAEPMIIMSSFEQTKMETFLEALKQAGISVPYKAMVTPFNMMWRCDELLAELKKEHEQMQKMRKTDE